MTYHWRLLSKPTGSDAVIEGVGENVNFSADELGDYLVELFVSDGALRSESIQTTVTVSITET